MASKTTTGLNETKPVQSTQTAPRRRSGKGGSVTSPTGAAAHTAPKRTNAAVYAVPARKTPAMQTMTANGLPTGVGRAATPRSQNQPLAGYSALMGLGKKG